MSKTIDERVVEMRFDRQFMVLRNRKPKWICKDHLLQLKYSKWGSNCDHSAIWAWNP